MRADGYGERRTAACSIPGSPQSAAYAVAAATLSRASWRGTPWPTIRRASRVAIASAIAGRLTHVRGDRVDDLGVAGAAAKVALEGGAGRPAGRAPAAPRGCERRQQHGPRAGGAP